MVEGYAKLPLIREEQAKAGEHPNPYLQSSKKFFKRN